MGVAETTHKSLGVARPPPFGLSVDSTTPNQLIWKWPNHPKGMVVVWSSPRANNKKLKKKKKRSGFGLGVTEPPPKVIGMVRSPPMAKKVRIRVWLESGRTHP
jgi:hypothetical protein